MCVFCDNVHVVLRPYLRDRYRKRKNKRRRTCRLFVFTQDLECGGIGVDKRIVVAEEDHAVRGAVHGFEDLAGAGINDLCKDLPRGDPGILGHQIVI